MCTGGANAAEWEFSDATQQVWNDLERCDVHPDPLSIAQADTPVAVVLQLLRRAGTLLMQREVPEHVNLQAAQVPTTLHYAKSYSIPAFAAPPLLMLSMTSWLLCCHCTCCATAASLWPALSACNTHQRCFFCAASQGRWRDRDP